MFAAAMLAGCGGAAQSPDESGEDFAQRINGASSSVDGTAPVAPGPATAPQITPTRPGVVPGPLERGTATDIASASCGANNGADIIGRQWTAALDTAVAAIVPDGGSFRVRAPGAIVTQDRQADRLNVMLDNANTVRDLRCG